MRELPPLRFDLSVYSTEQSFLWEDKWHASTGVDDADFLLDLRNVEEPGGSAIAIQPAVQLAATRIDRPDAGTAVGSAASAAGLTHYEHSLSASLKFFWRRGIAYKLTTASFARAEGLLYTSYKDLGRVLPTETVVFNPTNDTIGVSYFPLGGGRPQPTNSLTKLKLAVLGMGSLNADMEWRLAGRGFNDPLARGDWTNLEPAWNDPTTTNFNTNTGEVDPSSLPTGNQWIELALAVRKGVGTDPNSRCIFKVLPALKYS